MDAKKIRVAWNKGIKKESPCVICNKLIKYSKWGSPLKTCSVECLHELRSKIAKDYILPSQIGKKWGVDFPIENHNWWRGGITPVRGQIWKSKEFQEWRTSIFERDNYTCQICKKVGGTLNVDHSPIPFSEILVNKNIKSLEDAINCEDLWNINNGRTLCVDCHRLTPTYGVNQKYRKYGTI